MKSSQHVIYFLIQIKIVRLKVKEYSNKLVFFSLQYAEEEVMVRQSQYYLNNFMGITNQIIIYPMSLEDQLSPEK